jgi:hypothetical protein
MGIFRKNSYEDIDRYGVRPTAEVTIRPHLQTFEQTRHATPRYEVV